MNSSTGSDGRRRLFLAGRWEDGEGSLEIRDPFQGERVAEVARAGSATVQEAIAAASAASDTMRRLASYARAKILRRASETISDRREEFARTITRENGKPIRASRVEVERAVHTFAIAAEEATRIGGEGIPLDLRPGLEGRFGWVRRVPVGPVLGISPFNFPLNLVAHKVAPALAAGCPIVLKPSSRTPLSALLLAEVLEEAGLPPGGLSVLPCDRMVGDLLVADERFGALSFTGSPEVGFALQTKAGKKHVVLELGGNAGAIVCSDADLDDAAERLAAGAFAYAGQVCISVQRIFVHESVYEPFLERLVARSEALATGDPLAEETFVGPMIDEENARRIESWIEEARQRGAKVLIGGVRDGRLVPPTVLVDVDPELAIDCREAFGPVVNVHRYRAFGEALAAVNASRYGLQAGVFTRDFGRVLRAFDELEVGGVVVNDAPTFRVDSMPYGGVKDSGRGREGVRSAIEHFTEPRLLAVRPPEPRDGDERSSGA